MERGSVVELLRAAVERSGFHQLEVEIGSVLEDRVGAGSIADRASGSKLMYDRRVGQTCSKSSTSGTSRPSVGILRYGVVSRKLTGSTSTTWSAGMVRSVRTSRSPPSKWRVMVPSS